MDLKKRLLDLISPIEYDLILKPDLTNFTFSGEEILNFNLLKNSKKIILNAKKLIITKAILISNSKEIEARISYKEQEMLVLFTFPKEIKKGKYKLKLAFNGKLNADALKGWYKSSYTINGQKKFLATTQFEEIGAREVFPSVDDPSAKAVFNISLVVPKDLTTISNTIDKKVIEHENGWKTVTFTPTPKMATYALAFVVGQFEFLEKKATNGKLVRVFVTPGKLSQAKFALDVACRLLTFYEKYFDIAYPLPVLDLIAIPDFDAGAMENWGAITFREVALLVDEKETSAANKQWVAIVIAHEISHMWFGNLVTMKWWNDLWLNEGFASYMEYVGVNNFFPEWKMWEQFAVLDHNRALGLDGLITTHPIQAKLESVEKISEIFDEVSYSKGASVIQMLATFLGEENFRNGLRYYIKKFAYGNASTQDLWNALEKVSGKKVVALMDKYTKKPGYPIVTLNKNQLFQTRFFKSNIIRRKTKDSTIWNIPLKSITDKGDVDLLISKKSLKLKNDFDWIKLNKNETTFARIIYDKENLAKLKLVIEKKIISPIDRMGIIRDIFDSAESGYTRLDLALSVAKSYKNEDSYIVWAALLGKLSKVKNLIDLEDENKFNNYALSILSEIDKKINWDKASEDSHEKILLRSLILSNLGEYKDSKIVEKAKKLFELVKEKKQKVDTDIRGAVYSIVAENGDEKTFNELKDLYINEEMHAEKNRIGSALCLFKDGNVIKKALEFSISEHVRSQDIGRFLVISFENKFARDAVWKFIKNNWLLLITKMEGIGMDWIIKGAATITDKKLYIDIKEFFKSHPHPKLEKTMSQVLEQIESNIEWKDREEADLKKFLISNS